MRLLLVAFALLAVGVQERADLVKPVQADRTVRSYQITGINVTIPPTIYKLPTATTAAPPPLGMFSANLTIRYTDNFGTESVDAHSDASADKLVRDLLLAPSPTSGSLTARLLQHLISEGKIPAARITK